MPTHSIVIPLYNKVHNITATLESLMLQKKQPDELIIVDDVSTDNSLNTVKQYLAKNSSHFKNVRIEIVELPQNGGPGNARNVGLERSTCELISFLDADDLYHPDLLLAASQKFESGGYDFMVLDMEFLPDGDIFPRLSGLKPYLKPVTENFYEIKNPLKAVSSPHFILGVGSNVIVKRKYLQSVKYHSHAKLNEGIDFWYRVLKQIFTEKTGNVCLLSGNYLKVCEVKGSLSRQTYKHFREIPLPPVVIRYRRSKDIHDRMLVGMIGRRWYWYSLINLGSMRQRFLFIVHYSYLLPEFVGYELTRLYKG